MARKLPVIPLKYYTYIGVACAFVGALLVLCAILAILKILDTGFELAWAFFTAGGLLFMLAATLAFNKIGQRKVPV